MIYINVFTVGLAVLFLRKKMREAEGKVQLDYKQKIKLYFFNSKKYSFG